MEKKRLLLLFARIISGVIPIRSWRHKLRDCVVGKQEDHDSCFSRFEEIDAKKRDLIKFADSIEILFLGSSHTDYGINPEFISACAFNLGSNSQDLFTSEQLLKKVVPLLKRLKMVVLSYSLFSRGHNIAKIRDATIRSAYKLIWDIDYSNGNYLADSQNGKRLEKIEKKRIYRGYLFHNGKSMMQDAASRVAGHLKHFKYESQNYIVVKIFEYLKAHRIALRVFIPPVRQDYYDVVPKNKDWFDEIKRDCKKCGIELADFFGDQEFTDADFLDTDHLGIMGAEKLTKKINDWLTADL